MKRPKSPNHCAALMHPLAPVPCRGLEKSASALFRIGHKAQQPFLDSEVQILDESVFSIYREEV